MKAAELDVGFDSSPSDVMRFEIEELMFSFFVFFVFVYFIIKMMTVC